MMTRIVFVTACLCCANIAFAQPPLNKRDQKRKAEFEAQILAEENYDKTMKLADEAFRSKDYPEARRLYAEAMQYNQNKEQWLQSKVNDLDILMARTIARKVDSITAMAATRPQALKTEMVKTPEISGRNDLPVEPAAEEKAHTKAPTDAKPTESEKPMAAPEVKAAAPREPEPMADPFKDFPQGITEEDFEFKNHRVKRIVVKDGIDTIVFKFVTHQWGGKFYFKDDVSVSERTWMEEVAKYRIKFAESQD